MSVDSKIRLSDGTEVKASELKKGEKLLGITADGNEREQEVVSVVLTESVSVNVTHAKGQFLCSETHAILTLDSDPRPAGTLQPGDSVLLLNIGESEVTEVTSVGSLPVISITCEPDHTFYANGVASHNTKVIWPVGEAYL
ncbi:MAG: Hint domain-containing protein [Armatimonadota bacterium]